MASQDAANHRRTVFQYLLLYRWLSLSPALMALAARAEAPGSAPAILAIAALDNLVITAFHARLNLLVQSRPALLGVDLLFCAALIAASGGVHSPYYLYSLSPLLAAAFFFQMRGGLAAAAVLAGLYGAALEAGVRYFGDAVDLLIAVNQVAGYFLIAGMFGYPAVLLTRLRRSAEALQQAHDELVHKNTALERAHRELRSIYSMTVALQSAAVEVRDVQEWLLRTLVVDLGYSRSAVALIVHEQACLTSWMALDNRADKVDASVYQVALPLHDGDSPILDVIRSGETRVVTDGAPPTGCEEINRVLALTRYAILPLVIRAIPVGVLLLESPNGDGLGDDALSSARSIAEHGSLALWTTRMCMERTQRLTIQEERDRIAREIHDTISQSLFGIAYTLDACARLLPQQPDGVKERLRDLHHLAVRTMTQMREFIFDMGLGSLTTDQFIDELRASVDDVPGPDRLQVDVAVEGDITQLSPLTRKSLFRIAQEALTNVVKHAGASRAAVRLEASDRLVRLTVNDDGRGFDPVASKPGFGLAGMRARARSIGGTLDVRRAAGGGTEVEVRVPRL